MSVVIEQQGEGFALSSKSKPLLTPGGHLAVLPNAALAEAVAAEWRAQNPKEKKPMPVTRLACVALDMQADDAQRADIVKQLLEYAETDLISYRSDIAMLHKQQEEAFAPLLAWAHERFGVTFEITSGVMPVRQPAANQKAFENALAKYDAWKLAVLFAVVKPLGSLVLALAFIEGQVNAQTAFYFGHLEEAYETFKWGMDAEKEARLEGVKNEVFQAAAFLELAQAEGCQEQSDFN